eukprot:gene15207-6410_t
MKTGPFGAFLRKARKWWTFKSIVVLIGCLYISTFSIIMPLICRELGYSSFFASDRLQEKVDLRNKERLEASLNFLGKYAKSNGVVGGLRKRKAGLKICVAILSKSRSNSPGYLIQTFSKLVKETYNLTSYFNLNVINAEFPPELNKDAVKLQSFDIGNYYIAHKDNQRAYLEELDPYDKHRVDLIEALSVCNSRAYHFALVLEDDAFAGENFGLVFDYLFQSFYKDVSLGYVKLYHPEKWQGFGYDTKLELSCVVVVTVTLVTTILLSIAGRANWSLRQIFQGLVLLLLISAYVLIFVYTFSRQHILETLKFSKFTHFIVNGPGCCTSAMLYPTRVLDELISFLRTGLVCSRNNPIDIALANYFESNGKNRLLVVPNLFYHIGYYSSVSGAKDPREFFHLYPPKI